ncbi:hypothetical protein [Paraburkholderia phenoliruptrix]|uniref:Uncharacterized protein n=2 Tax=Paraburkholderia phenoliruptrix TaxID=252970 RepID=K0E1V2_9BURK|nr:hypothetical protein [Paraburkholderia phenoliruptrix]AFT90448.1 hypothetical protein BUPH_04883 [Paraburkholderia phenoliruptrix BR3459a]CAB4051859.1 hypothetical protein LMG9964_05539 [Paraburkholderia phenoliruptrix]
MGAADDAIREELIGAVLGELALLRRDVKQLSQLLEASGKQFRDDGELTLLRFAARSEQFLEKFSESTADVLAKAASFDEARDQLLGEISLRHYDEANGRSRELLREEQQRAGRIGHTEFAVWSVCTAIGAALLSGANAALHLFGA